MKTWLVIDVSYMCHRAFHMAKDLSWKGKATGVVFGFLKSISFLKDEFQTDRIAFCFDHPHNRRKDVFPPYKKKRNTIERTPEEQEAYKGLQIQISELRQRYLPLIGFKNIFCANGYESDDVMAAMAKYVAADHELILVTADQDLYQCLGSQISIYSPHKRLLLGGGWFEGQYKIRPWQWAQVKAIAGCSSDEVPGIKGVGEITALRYLRGELKPTSAAYLAIRSREGRAIVRRNRPLVELPYQGCPIPVLQDDEVSTKGWKEVCQLLGMKTIAGRPPVATKKLFSYAKR